jgi:hypothetical protein
MRAYLIVIFAVLANRLVAGAMNVVAFCFTKTALWQGSVVPSFIAMNNFTAYTGLIVARCCNFKGDATQVAFSIVFLHR